MSTLFISDLHLHENRPHITEAFFSFLQREARSANSLYILGDLFDAWIGDDDNRPLANSVAAALKSISTHTAIFFQHGNRDFLLGEAYARRSGMSLLPELFILPIAGQRWLLAHGDQFCTRDVAYQQLRAQTRNPAWQQHVLSKSLDERRAMAKQLREKSQDANSLKPEDIMDVTQSEIEDILEKSQCNKLIHGHTHRPARHPVRLANTNMAERVVLGDWGSTFWFLHESKGSVNLTEQRLA